MHCIRLSVFLVLLIIITSVYGTVQANDDYKAKRAKLLEKELISTLGGDIELTDKETNVNECLMKYKCDEVDRAFDNPHYFNFSRHFFTYKNYIKFSTVYKIIKEMPKGAALHVHDMGILGPDYLLNVTYMNNLYVCFEEKFPLLKFALEIPVEKCNHKWQLMNEARQSAKNRTRFDENLRKHFTMFVHDPDVKYPSIVESWATFINYYATVVPMLSFRPVWEQYFYDALKKFRDENLQYVEVRSILPSLYELDGTVYDPLITAQSYNRAIKKFMKEYPDFFGAKIIYAPSRKVNPNQLNNYLELARRIKQKLPDIFAGFDLVGQEDVGNPLLEFVPQLLAAEEEFHYFFHAGETNWYGTSTDENLLDAILLGAKRLGHAYALPKHPVLIEEVRKNNIGLEVNVISNAVLSLVKDIRNHPLSEFLAQNLPVVLSSDDPGVWEADPISEDFYVAFVGVASRLSDLKLLKKLALNSLTYSALDAQEKNRAIKLFNRKWDYFINNFDYCK